MGKKSSYFLMILLAFFLLFCENSPIVKTSGTDSDNFFKGKVFTSQMEPLSNSKIYLIKVELINNGLKSEIVDSTISDNEGNWKLKRQDDGIYYVYAKGNNIYKSSLKKLFTVFDSNYSYKVINFQSEKILKGHVFIENSLQNEDIYVFIAGTNIKTKVNRDGSYFLENVPSGDCDLIFKTEAGNFIAYLRINSSKQFFYIRDYQLPIVKDTLLNSEFTNCKIVTPKIYNPKNEPLYYDSISIDGIEYLIYKDGEELKLDLTNEKLLLLLNFEYPGDKTLLHDWWSGSGLNSIYYSYILSDSSLKIIDENLRPDSATFIYSKGCRVDVYRLPSELGYSLYAKFIYGDLTPSTLGSVTIFFDKLYGDVNNNVNLSKLKSVNFYAKGNGKIKVLLQDSVILNHYYLSMFAKEIVLENSWKYYKIPLDDFVTEIDTNSIGLHRSEAIRKIEYLKFLTVANPGDTVEFWLDEISLSGVTISDLKQR